MEDPRTGSLPPVPGVGTHTQARACASAEGSVPGLVPSYHGNVIRVNLAAPIRTALALALGLSLARSLGCSVSLAFDDTLVHFKYNGV